MIIVPILALVAVAWGVSQALKPEPGPTKLSIPSEVLRSGQVAQVYAGTRAGIKTAVDMDISKGAATVSEAFLDGLTQAWLRGNPGELQPIVGTLAQNKYTSTAQAVVSRIQQVMALAQTTPPVPVTSSGYGC